MKEVFIMKYAIYQMDVLTADPEEYREKIQDWINERVKQDKPDMVVLPEMWNTGYALAGAIGPRPRRWPAHALRRALARGRCGHGGLVCTTVRPHKQGSARYGAACLILL